MGWKTPLNGNNMYDLKPDLMSRFLTKRWNRLKKFKMDPVAYEPKVSIYKTLGRSFWLSFLWATFFQVLTLILNQVNIYSNRVYRKYFMAFWLVPVVTSNFEPFDQLHHEFWTRMERLSLHDANGGCEHAKNLDPLPQLFHVHRNWPERSDHAYFRHLRKDISIEFIFQTTKIRCG